MKTDNAHDGYISIGQFANEAQLTIKALRLYQTKGLLTPAYIDPFTNYRYYEADQVQTAQLIRLLRQMDMPLKMVRNVIEVHQTDPAEAEAVMHKYLQLFNARVALVHQTVDQVLNLIQPKESQMTTDRDICLNDLPPVESHKLLEVLTRVMDAADDVLPPDQYRLVGTTASILHGVELPSKGVDFLMRDHETVDALHLAMTPFRCDSPPTYIPEEKQYFASYFVDDVNLGVSTVEWDAASDGIECCGTGPWQHFTTLTHGEHSMPTVNLELRLVSELCRNRPDRYEPLIAYMRNQDCDLDLIRRGMTERQISVARQDQIIAQLQG